MNDRMLFADATEISKVMHFHGSVDDVQWGLCYATLLSSWSVPLPTFWTVIKPWSEGVEIYVPAEHSSSQIAHVTKYNDPQSCCPCKWPPISPDLNPLWYHPWSIIKKEGNQQTCTTKYLLKVAIMNVKSKMYQNDQIWTCSCF